MVDTGFNELGHPCLIACLICNGVFRRNISRLNIDTEHIKIICIYQNTSGLVEDGEMMITPALYPTSPPQCQIRNKMSLSTSFGYENSRNMAYVSITLSRYQRTLSSMPARQCQPRRCRPPVGSLTHWGRVTHICVGNLIIIGPDNGLSPGRRQAIISTNAGILLIGPWGTNFSEISIGIHTFSFKKIHLKVSLAKWRPFCLGLNVLSPIQYLHKLT